MNKLPKPDKAEYIYRTIKSSLSTIPIVGGPVVELFTSLLQSPLEKRKEKWFLKIAQDLARCTNSIDDIEQRFKEDVFVSIFLNASRVAMLTHQPETQNSLRNAILNSFNNTKGLTEEKQLFFINLLQTMTPTHLKVINFYSPNREIERMESGEYPLNFPKTPLDYIESEFYEYRGSGYDFLKHILNQLIDSVIIKRVDPANDELTAVWKNLLKTKSDEELIKISEKLIHYRLSDIGVEFWSYTNEPIGIGTPITERPSHTTVHTGPYTAIRLIRQD